MVGVCSEPFVQNMTYFLPAVIFWSLLFERGVLIGRRWGVNIFLPPRCGVGAANFVRVCVFSAEYLGILVAGGFLFRVLLLLSLFSVCVCRRCENSVCPVPNPRLRCAYISLPAACAYVSDDLALKAVSTTHGLNKLLFFLLL